MIANVYIDGFNLYYGIIDTKKPYKWLDVGTLCRHILQGHTINRIRYFTARITPRPDDPDQALRQDVYLRALRTIPNLTIHEGHFLRSEKWSVIARPLASGVPTIPGVLELRGLPTAVPMAYVVKTEEKGSDVNLATYLLLDAFRKEYELGVLVTNDSDLAEPIRVVRSELGLQVGVLNPHTNISRTLQGAASFYRYIKQSSLRVAQFPDTVDTPTGPVTRPTSW